MTKQKFIKMKGEDVMWCVNHGCVWKPCIFCKEEEIKAQNS